MNRTLLVFAALMLSLACGTSNADVGVHVDTRSNATDRFLVTVYTRHADFHNGHSVVRFQGLVRANERRKVAIDFYVSLIGHGVSAYHPDYHVESAITESRWDELPTLFARRWDVILGEGKSLPHYASGSPEGASYFRLLHHVEAYGKAFLPALDRDGVMPDPAVLPHFAAVLARADALAAPATDSQRAGHALLMQQRAKVLPAIEKLLGLTRSQRLALVAFGDATYGALPGFVESVYRQQPGRGLPQSHGWQDPNTRLQFKYRLEEWYQQRGHQQLLDCARGQLTFDWPLPDGASQDLVKQVELSICRATGGRGWRIDSPWAP